MVSQKPYWFHHLCVSVLVNSNSGIVQEVVFGGMGPLKEELLCRHITLNLLVDETTVSGVSDMFTLPFWNVVQPIQ